MPVLRYLRTAGSTLAATLARDAAAGVASTANAKPTTSAAGTWVQCCDRMQLQPTATVAAIPALTASGTSSVTANAARTTTYTTKSFETAALTAFATLCSHPVSSAVWPRIQYGSRACRRRCRRRNTSPLRMRDVPIFRRPVQTAAMPTATEEASAHRGHFKDSRGARTRRVSRGTRTCRESRGIQVASANTPVAVAECYTAHRANADTDARSAFDDRSGAGGISAVGGDQRQTSAATTER